MIVLPAIDDHLFPNNSRQAIVRFWLWYWGYFFLFLPWMLLRQAFLSLRDTLGALWTWNRQITLLGDSLRIVSMNSISSLAITALFGERFTAIHYEDVLIDPGPVFGRKRLSRYLKQSSKAVHAVFATHAHEEHVGNVVLSSELTGAAIYGTQVTLNALRQPEMLTWMRRTFIGQPLAAVHADLRPVENDLETPCVHLTVIESPGHCAGHASLFDTARRILFAGDSFLHTIFTSPNKDVSGEDWIATLERYEALEIKTMVGTHGNVYSVDPNVAWRPFIVERTAPSEMIRDKLRFLRWRGTWLPRENEDRYRTASSRPACFLGSARGHGRTGLRMNPADCSAAANSRAHISSVAYRGHPSECRHDFRPSCDGHADYGG